MASKKQKPQGKATTKPQSDPWLKWCAPAQGADVQRFLDNAETVPEPLASCDALFDADELFYARLVISNAADDIIPEAHDAEAHPVPALESLEVNSEKQFTLNRISEQTFYILKHISEVWPHPKAVERLKNFANVLVQLLYAAQEFGRKKIELATTMKRMDAAAKLGKAYKDFCMIDLTGDIDTDAKRLFLERKITHDEFRAAMRRAFALDRQATKEINANGETQAFMPNAPTPRKRYPVDPEATKVLIEGARRKKEKAYRGDSNEAIMLLMIEEPHSIYRERMLYGRLKGKAGGQVRERVICLDKHKAAKNWGKYLSAYIICHKKD